MHLQPHKSSVLLPSSKDLYKCGSSTPLHVLCLTWGLLLCVPVQHRSLLPQMIPVCSLPGFIQTIRCIAHAAQNPRTEDSYKSSTTTQTTSTPTHADTPVHQLSTQALVDEVTKLRQNISTYDNAYYNTTEPVVSDDVYDSLKQSLGKWEEQLAAELGQQQQLQNTPQQTVVRPSGRVSHRCVPLP